MTIKDYVKQKQQEIGDGKLSSNPKDERLDFVNDQDALRISNAKANKVWYEGSGDELLNWYTQRNLRQGTANWIYNRNQRNYFWQESSTEQNIKRVHTGIPNAIVTTLCNVLNRPQVIEESGVWDEIAEENDFYTKLMQQARPLTMAMGWGAWKVNINTKLSNHPIWEYYDAEDVDYIYNSGILTGVIFSTFYRKNNRDYVLIESRFKQNGNSYITYDLFEEGDSKEIIPVDLVELEETKDLKNLVINGFNEILAVPTRYFYSTNDSKYGRSIYDGKLDLFDYLDEIWSIASETNRSSVPITWVSPDVMDRGQNGLPTMPSRWNMKFMQKPSVPDGDGNINDDVVVTQPQVNSDQYTVLANEVTSLILIGVLSPASLGIDVSRKDNADAQREKEKVTIMTRNGIIASEEKQIKKIVQLSLVLEEYIKTGEITLKPRECSVKFNEFANPSFEEELGVLGNAWVNGEISTKKYVDLLWKDTLNDAEKAEEIAWLDEQRQQQEPSMDDFLGEENGATIEDNVAGTRPKEESTDQAEAGMHQDNL